MTKLTQESVHINHFSKMRVNLDVHALSPAAAYEMNAHENTVTESTQKYINLCSRFFFK